MTFTKTHDAKRGTSTYKSAEGLTLYVPKSAGERPATIEVTGLTAPPARAAKAKTTPEERKARAAERKAANAGLTPAQKAQKRLDAAQAALAKAQKAGAAA
jgi:hypothetical protein